MFGSKGIRDVTKNDYRKAMNIFGKTNRVSQMNKFRCFIKNCIDTANDDGILVPDFTKNVVLISQKKNRNPKLNVIKSVTDAERVVKYLSENPIHKNDCFNLILYFLITTPGRQHELYSLSWEDLDIEKMEFRYFHEGWSLYFHHFSVGKSKYARSKRVIPFRKEGLKLLEEWKIRQKELYKQSIRTNKHNLIFAHPHFKHYFQASYTPMNRRWREILEELNLKHDLTVTGCRHTFATSVYSLNPDKKESLAALMSHESVKMLDGHYLSVSDEEENELTDFLKFGTKSWNSKDENERKDKLESQSSA